MLFSSVWVPMKGSCVKLTTDQFRHSLTFQVLSDMSMTHLPDLT